MLKYKDETIGIGHVDLSEIDYAYDNGYVSSNIVKLGGGSESAIGVTVVTNTDGSITFSGTATSGGTFYIVDKVCKGSTFAQADKFNLASGGYAMIDGSLTNANAVVKLSSADNNKILSNTPLKLESGDYAFAVIVSAGTVSGTIKPMISELPISAYQPYAKSNVELTHATNDDLKMLGWTVPIECTIQNYTDANRVFHQRVGRVDLGSLTWTLFKSDLNIFSASVVGIRNTTYAQMYSNIYNLANDKSVSAFANMDMRSSGNSAVVFIRNTSYSDADAFKSAMSGVYLYYELATEVTKSDGDEAVEELNSSLNYCVGFPNISSSAVLHTFSTNESWTATENCWIIGTIRYINSTQGDNDSSIKVNSIYVQTAYCSTGNVLTNVSMPISKGDVVSTSTYGTFNALKAYKCK